MEKKNLKFYIIKLLDILYKIYKLFYFKNKIINLRREILNYNYKYHVLNNSNILDYQYDKLIFKLKKLENLYPYLKNKYSSTKLVGARYKSLTFLKKIYHKIPMLSLNNVFNEQDLFKKFLFPINKIIKKLNFCCELKFDGIAINLLYKNGILISAATRGDGIIGENIIKNILKIKSIPHTLKGKNFPKNLEVRGEIFITKKNFKKLNQQRFDKYKLFSNTRNTAYGILKMNKNVDKKIFNLLNFYSYGIGFIDQIKFSNQQEILLKLEYFGIPISKYTRIYSSYYKIINFYKYFKKNRNLLPYNIDGIVIKINDVKKQNILGYTNHAPKWAMAYKFPSQEKLTLLKKIIFQIGRTGVITPIAYFNTVNINGVNINFATLYNINEIIRLNLKIGDHIIIQRCGDVIPKITNVVINKKFLKRKTNILIPTLCPSCNSILKKTTNNILYCKSGLFCKDQLKAYLKHFVSRDAFNIYYLGEKLINKLVDKNLVKNTVDLLNLNNHILSKIDNLGNKFINKILQSLKNKKTITFNKFLFSLGIPEMGTISCYYISLFFKTLENFLNTNLIELCSIKNIGKKTSLSIFNFISKKDNINIIKNLLKKIKIIYPIKISKKNYFYQKKITITGKFMFITRYNLVKKLKILGAVIHTQISKKTDLLILGTNPSSKLLKANKLNIKIINENKVFSLFQKYK
ncbi:NAD-dependent DNA ligase LigA [Enterobacteriaceae endosymbiont of Donacia bicoloricornis]|uniref:NAD-dependent DNA ligase LigA n=1 Tax=Enterobacteriaceae endosymbiont of Donacia bicoloricornis TaxID=2675772 RepID=UPI0014490BF7|nr:NAD-dependent DNA ligase LigA [Enterobacteriaceae endosymbiont of Donacia bicoloricornis]QJC37577.1 NAD-dependent DNA ligase LigA [Enterobacteriaceae endosymbiont of Donacia bicoloricornis]